MLRYVLEGISKTSVDSPLSIVVVLVTTAGAILASERHANNPNKHCDSTVAVVTPEQQAFYYLNRIFHNDTPDCEQQPLSIHNKYFRQEHTWVVV